MIQIQNSSRSCKDGDPCGCPICIDLTRGSSTSVGARVVMGCGEGLYGRPWAGDLSPTLLWPELEGDPSAFGGDKLFESRSLPVEAGAAACGVGPLAGAFRPPPPLWLPLPEKPTRVSPYWFGRLLLLMLMSLPVEAGVDGHGGGAPCGCLSSFLDRTAKRVGERASIPPPPLQTRWAPPKKRDLAGVLLLSLVLFLMVIFTSCSSSNQQTQQPDPRLKSFHIISAHIIMLDSQAEVDGTVQNLGNDAFPFDVTIVATFYDSSGHVIGQAQGAAEDVFPGMIRSFVLMGQVDSLRYSHMKLSPVSLRERRYEKNLPTPTPVVP